MSSLESTKTAGSWPTPPRVAEVIARHLVPGPTGTRQVIRLLDPCAGTGEAASQVAEAIGAETFGIEINHDRASALRNTIRNALAPPTRQPVSSVCTTGASRSSARNAPYTVPTAPAVHRCASCASALWVTCTPATACSTAGTLRWGTPNP